MIRSKGTPLSEWVNNLTQSSDAAERNVCRVKELSGNFEAQIAKGPTCA